MKKVFLENLPKWENGTSKGKTNWTESVGHKVKFIYEDVEGEIEIVDCIDDYLFISYKDKTNFKIKKSNFMYCKLSRITNKRTNEFRLKVGYVLKDEKRDLIITDRKYIKDKNGQNKKYYKYKCNKCGFDGEEHYRDGEYEKDLWIEESNLLNGKGCPCCSNPCKIVVPNINSIATTDPWMIQYFQNPEDAKKYTRSSSTRIYPVCPDCGCVKNKSVLIYSICATKSISCKKCGDGVSYPEKIAFNVLKQLNVDFISEYSPKWIGKYRYDFYFELENNKYILEMDGGWHTRNNLMSGITKEKSKYIDDYKDMMAEQHGIEVIRIDAYKSELEYIKNNILNSNLSNLFNLSNIDWLQCEKYSLSNRIKETCLIRKNNPNLSLRQISEVVGVGSEAIRRYLKKGTELGWCYYNAKEEKEKNNKKNAERNKKRCSKLVEIFKDGISLGIFESCSELERQSEGLFGVKLKSSCISVASNKAKYYKGFTFKYI